jgi:hypothetical protein
MNPQYNHCENGKELWGSREPEYLTFNELDFNECSGSSASKNYEKTICIDSAVNLSWFTSAVI